MITILRFVGICLAAGFFASWGVGLSNLLMITNEPYTYLQRVALLIISVLLVSIAFGVGSFAR